MNGFIVFQGANQDNIFANMVANRDVAQISSSWTISGLTNTTKDLFTLLASQGQTFVTATGDWGEVWCWGQSTDLAVPSVTPTMVPLLPL